jgi:hypothetical protein
MYDVGLMSRHTPNCALAGAVDAMRTIRILAIKSRENLPLIRRILNQPLMMVAMINN